VLTACFYTDEVLDVYVMGRVQLPVDNARRTTSNADEESVEPRVPNVVQEMFNSLHIQLEATIIEKTLVNSPVLGPETSHGGLSPGQRPLAQRASSPIPLAASLPGPANSPHQGPSGTPRLRPESAAAGSSSHAKHQSTPASPLLGPNSAASQRPGHRLPRRSSSIRSESLSPSLRPRAGSEPRHMVETLSGTQIYQEQRAASEGPMSSIQLFNEAWCCAFKFSVPVGKSYYWQGIICVNTHHHH
jgi:hypothetical protein